MKNDMRVRRGGSDRLIRRFIAGTVLLMLLLLGGRYIGRAAGSIPRNDYRRMIKAGGQWLVETIWIQAQPGKRISGEGGGDPYVGQADPDPSYRKYQAVRPFTRSISIWPGMATRRRGSSRRRMSSWQRHRAREAARELNMSREMRTGIHIPREMPAGAALPAAGCRAAAGPWRFRKP